MTGLLLSTRMVDSTGTGMGSFTGRMDLLLSFQMADNTGTGMDIFTGMTGLLSSIQTANSYGTEMDRGSTKSDPGLKPVPPDPEDRTRRQR